MASPRDVTILALQACASWYQATSLPGLELLAQEASSSLCLRPYAASVGGLDAYNVSVCMDMHLFVAWITLVITPSPTSSHSSPTANGTELSRPVIHFLNLTAATPRVITSRG